MNARDYTTHKSTVLLLFAITLVVETRVPEDSLSVSKTHRSQVRHYERRADILADISTYIQQAFFKAETRISSYNKLVTPLPIERNISVLPFYQTIVNP